MFVCCVCAQPWREQEEVREEMKRKRQEEEEGDTMAQLEHRTLDRSLITHARTRPVEGFVETPGHHRKE